MTFRIYGETGELCRDPGWYRCRKHPEVEEYFGWHERFTVCPGEKDGPDEAHETTWILIKRR